MREYHLMPWQLELLTMDEIDEIIKDQNAHHRAMRRQARKRSG